MVMNVEIISEEIIKPSSPTPDHLRNFKLSFLDQIAPSFYTSVIFFYHSNRDLNVDPLEGSCRLKKSLAEILTRFYPLAGTLDYEDFSIDCNDVGMDYIEARVSCKLSEMVEKFNGKALIPLLPVDPYRNCTGPGKTVLLAVQYNIFDCSGVAIGVVVSHKIADGISMATIVDAWAASSRGASEVINPSFDAAIHFPRIDIPTSSLVQITPMAKERLVAKRYVFDKSSIDSLRKEATVEFGPEERGPSRVEAVSAFIWRRFMAIARSNPGTKAKLLAVTHAVNLRQKMAPQLPAYSIGNLWQSASTALPMEVEKDYPSLLRQIRNAIMKINTDYVKNLQDSKGSFFDSLKRAIEESSKVETNSCSFSSWCRFPFYEADFGWGKPTWVACPVIPWKNVVVMMSTKDGDGIEVWVNMEEEEMFKFDHDPEMLPFVSSAAAE